MDAMNERVWYELKEVVDGKATVIGEYESIDAAYEAMVDRWQDMWHTDCDERHSYTEHGICSGYGKLTDNGGRKFAEWFIHYRQSPVQNQAGRSNEFVQTDDMQWQRSLGNGEYEMYQIVWIGNDPGVDKYFVGGGTFDISDYKDEVPYILETYGYGSMENFVKTYGDRSDDVLAECMFETAWCDFDLYSFATEDEAMAYVNELMRG